MDDGRSHRIVLVAHCLLNANAQAEGLARYAGVHAIIGELAGRGYSIVQLPCPEMAHVGCARQPFGPEVRESAEYRDLCVRLADRVADDVEQYLRCDVKTVAMVGLEGSQTCAVTRSCFGDTEGCDSPGMFVEELHKRLDAHGVHFLGISHREPEDNIPEVVAHLR